MAGLPNGSNTINFATFWETITGLNGTTTLTGTAEHVPATCDYFTKIVIIEDAVFTAVVGNFTGFAGITYPAGHVIFARITSLTLASGVIDVCEGN